MKAPEIQEKLSQADKALDGCPIFKQAAPTTALAMARNKLPGGFRLNCVEYSYALNWLLRHTESTHAGTVVDKGHAAVTCLSSMNGRYVSCDVNRKIRDQLSMLRDPDLRPAEKLLSEAALDNSGAIYTWKRQDGSHTPVRRVETPGSPLPDIYDLDHDPYVHVYTSGQLALDTLAAILEYNDLRRKSRKAPEGEQEAAKRQLADFVTSSRTHLPRFGSTR